MNEPSSVATPSRSSKLSFILPIVLGIVLIAGVGYWVATRSGVDRKLVESVLAQWSERLSAYGKAHGEQITFTYDKVEMKGEGAGRFAVVMNPVIRVTEKNEETGQELTSKASTAEIEIHPKSATLDDFELVAAKPIAYEQSGKAAVQVIAQSPIKTQLSRFMEGDIRLLRTVVHVPEHITLLPEKEQDKLEISIAPDAVYDVTATEDMSAIRALKLSLADIKISGANAETFLTVQSVHASANSQPLADGNTDATILASIDKLLTTEQDMAYGALSFALDVRYKGPVPKPQQQIDWASTPSTLSINQLSLSGADASASLSGAFETGSGELLPVGSAQLQVEHFDFVRSELLKHKTLDAQSQKLMDILLQKMTGTTPEQIHQLDVTIAREKGNSLKIGKLSFEEALAIVLTGGKLSPMPKQAPQPQPQLPAPAHTEGQ